MKLFRNIDELMLDRYAKITQTGDLKYLLHDIDSKYNKVVLLKTWDDIKYQLLEVTGVPEEMQEIIRRERELVLMRIDVLITKDNSINPIITVKNNELNDLLQSINNSESKDIDELIAYVEIVNKFQINASTTSIRRFYNYLKLTKEKINIDGKSDKEN